jgi:hypothetical protein
VIQLTGIENMQFKVILDEGSENGMVQFNDMPVDDSRNPMFTFFASYSLPFSFVIASGLCIAQEM